MPRDRRGTKNYDGHDRTASMVTSEKPRHNDTISTGSGNHDLFPPGDGGDGGDGGGRRPERTPPPEGYRIGIWLALASVTMMFLALTSAYVVNRAHVLPLEFPSILVVSTLVILMSSVTFEMTRRALRRRHEDAFMRWLLVTAGLGLGFLIAQLAAWRQLVASGFFVNTNRHSGFAYIFTGLHAAHLVGGILGLGYVVYKSKRGTWTAIRRRATVDATAIYWHFLDGLWIYLLVILFFWR
ncbi:MAG: cytochrome c oxidase subunit 3 [Acidobacteriota bacterium]